MRSTKELLQLMLDNRSCFTGGLCAWVTVMWCSNIITIGEQQLLMDYIRRNRPNWLSSTNAFKRRNSSYYWEPNVIEPRIKWLKKHIKRQGLRL